MYFFLSGNASSFHSIKKNTFSQYFYLCATLDIVFISHETPAQHYNLPLSFIFYRSSCRRHVFRTTGLRKKNEPLFVKFMSNRKKSYCSFYETWCVSVTKIYKHTQEISINNQYHILITLRQNDIIATIRITYRLLTMLKRYNINQDKMSYEHRPRKCYCKCNPLMWNLWCLLLIGEP